MLNEGDKKVILKIIGAAIAVFIIVYSGTNIIDGEKFLPEIIKNIDVKDMPHPTDRNIVQPPDPKTILPDINKEYPLKVNSSTSSYIEIFSSTEKAGSGTDGWLTEVAKDFNNAGIMIDGKQVSVKLRGIPSGQGADYIAFGKYLPDAYTPSNEFWGEMIRSRGVKAELVQKRLVGNVAGIVLTKPKKDELVNKYGAINTSTIIDAVANKELAMGYTNPFYSATGLNFLISALEAIDSSDLLSDKAKAGFKSFQDNNTVTAYYTTLQMRNAVESGRLDGLILEYQTYVNAPNIRSYEFIPFGFRHDNPVYAIGVLSAEKREILDKFIEFTQQEKYQTLATKYGFNGLNEYQSEARAVSGNEIIQAQQVWKETKNTICAVFVADVSGSMDGEPLNKLRRSLIDGQYYIGKDNLIGLVSYSNDVNIDLPIAKLDENQRYKFAGAVKDLRAGGSTATFDAIAVAMNMLIEQKAAGPDADPYLRPKIFVLSDGETNAGHSLDDIGHIVQELGIPIYTIGYNADIPELQKISDINEAVCINADNENVTYKLGQLFNVEM